jgi:ribonuclease HII
MLKARFQEDAIIEAGIDEVGRGCLWGPLVTAAVVWPPEDTWTEAIRELVPQIKDSKKISEKKRPVIAEKIKVHAADVGIGRVGPNEIDALGMSRSNQLGFSRALSALRAPPGRILVDGILPLPADLWQGEQHTIVEGDAKYLTIAAASIVAKVHRDTWVKTWSEANSAVAEQYGFAKNKGYGTAVHRAAVKTHGLHEYHRTLFLRKILGDAIHKRVTECQIQDDPDS